MPRQYFGFNFRQRASGAGINNVTPPTFAGIAAATPSTNGDILATWLAASGPTVLPIAYDIYIATGSVSAAALFTAVNLVIRRTQGLAARVFSLADGTYLVAGQQYTLGVRATSAVGVSETNTVTQVVTATGSTNLASIYQTLAATFGAENAAYAGHNSDHAANNLAASGINTALEARVVELETENDLYQTLNLEHLALNDAASGINTDLVERVVELSEVTLAASGVVDALSLQVDQVEDAASSIEASRVALAALEVDLSADVGTLGTITPTLVAASTVIDVSASSIAESASALDVAVVQIDLELDRLEAIVAEVDPIFVVGDLSGVVEKESDV